MSFFTVLLVDDFESWRRFVSSTLKHKPKIHIVSEALDVVDAVQKARELQPDLIVLDIGLPKLNGIQAARQIRNVAPKSKILFLTENPARDIATEALRSGARGYVVKSDAGTELLEAVEAVLQGKYFISARLANLEFTHNADAQDSVLLPIPSD
jgi:DNA-binding NarL/FixJ family response regulator